MFIEPYLANITIFGGNFAPLNWAFCDGSLLSISENDALFALIGTTYGGDGQTNFALPDLRSRVAIHQGQGNGMTFIGLGQVGGNESVTISGGQLAQHTHLVSSVSGAQPASSSTTGNVPDPSGNVPAAIPNIPAYETAGAPGLLNPSTIPVPSTIVGASQPVPTTPPYLTMNYIICTQGIFPSRN